MINLKKILLILLSLFLVFSFSACSAGGDAEEAADPAASVSETAAEEAASTVTDEDGHVHAALEDSDKDISEASLTEAEATDRIKALSMEQLGLEGSKDDYKFMVATVGKVIDEKDYIQVIAAVVSEEDENGSVNIDPRGTYYISYDGTQMLSEDPETGELEEIHE